MIQFSASSLPPPGGADSTPFRLDLQLRARDPKELADQLLLLADSVRQMGGVAVRVEPQADHGNLAS